MDSIDPILDRHSAAAVGRGPLQSFFGVPRSDTPVTCPFPQVGIFSEAVYKIVYNRGQLTRRGLATQNLPH